MPVRTGLSGARVAVVGALATMTLDEARRLVERLGGRLDALPSDQTSLVVVGTNGQPGASGPPVADQVRRPDGAVPEIVDEDEWCRRVGRVGPSSLRQHYYPLRTVRSLYPRVRADHLRYLERWGLLRDVVRTPDEVWYSFADVSVIRQVHAELDAGTAFRGVLRELAAQTTGQLSLDFRPPRGDVQPAKVVSLRERTRGDGTPAAAGLAGPTERTPAEMKFLEASQLEEGHVEDIETAMAAYRAALELDPDLVPAMINLGNLHYLLDRLAEAQALYLQASLVDPECFEAWFNLGNVHHDRLRLEEAAQCYGEALRLVPAYANAHFYLAVTLEKLGRPAQAKVHWRAYQQLAPDGEWIELAREFGE